MRLLMLAGPGAGKGTQAQRLADHYGVEHVASGDLLRAEVEAGTDVGQAVEAAMNSGDLVPDDVILEIIGQRLIAASQQGGYVLDGYPRNLAQAKRAFEMAREVGNIELQAVVHLRVARDELERRMLARAEEEGRLDDTRATIEHRLAVFDEQTQPLVRYYTDRGLVHSIDGNQDVEDVTAAILEALADLATDDDGPARQSSA
ncbi:MAG: adenylate kinase [Actinomycetota bacterium]|nr:adenylate kinase [Actinomycetota bacterium]